MLKINLYSLLGLFLVILIAGCCKPKVSHREDISRDYFTVDLSNCSKPYQDSQPVGGEHLNFYHFILKENQKYELKVTSNLGKVSPTLQKFAGDIEAYSEKDEISAQSKQAKQSTYLINSKKMKEVTLQVSAYPEGEYTLSIAEIKNN